MSYARLCIDDDERGYEEWEEGDYIHLKLTNGFTANGEIKEILFSELTIVDEDGDTQIVSFDEIEGYY
jgi:hypothetical protein